MKSLTCLIETKGNEKRVLSPTVGLYFPFYESGANLRSQDPIGRIRILNNTYNLILPRNTEGTITQCLNSNYQMPVEYGQELLLLSPISDQLPEKISQIGKSEEKNRQDEEKKGFLITAFTTGIFYGKPSPDAPPFVSVGQKIEKGKNLGLIEVMKTFNHIIFQGTGKSEYGVVKNIYVQDGREVKSGQPLFLIE